MWSHRPHTLREDWIIPLILSVFFLSIYMPNLGGYGLFDPWETHYGEVARNMIEHQNYIDPFWGSPWDTENVKRERKGFYSKPPLTMWLMAVGMQLAGVNALGTRLLFPLLALCALLSIYLSLSRLVSRRAGLIASLTCGLTPSFGFLSHQAVTDGPMVSLVVIGIMSLSMALFTCREGEEGSRLLKSVTYGVLLFVIIGQLWAIWPMDRSPDAIRTSPYDQLWFRFQWWLRELMVVGKGKGWVLVVLLSPVCVWAVIMVGRIRSRRMLYFTLFYICCGLTVPAKGWLGWAPMGGALFFYLLTSREWHWVRAARPWFGLLIVFVTGHLWIIAMLGGHHPDWVNRFIYHDHINRLFMGVHSTDDGAFEYFFQWIGYGIFPVIALLPAAFARSLNVLKKLSTIGGDDDRIQTYKFEALIFLWAVVGFFLFTKSNTKFHHYIFPVLPALCILIALWFEDAWRGLIHRRVLFVVTAMGILIWVGNDLYRPSAAPGQGSQNWINLFTYKYDRKWPIPPDEQRLDHLRSEAASKAWRTQLHLPLTIEEQAQHSPKLKEAITNQEWTRDLSEPVWYVTLLAFFGLILLSLSQLWLNRLGISLFLASSVWISIFCLHTYLPYVAPHWSQWELWDHYYQNCTHIPKEREEEFRQHLLTTTSRVPSQLDIFPRQWCQEPIIAFRMNWRGEAFYSGNTVIPILYTKDLKPFLKQWGIFKKWREGKTFYLFTERSRIKSELERSLPTYLKGKYKEVFGEGKKFVLLKVDPTLP